MNDLRLRKRNLGPALSQDTSADENAAPSDASVAEYDSWVRVPGSYVLRAVCKFVSIRVSLK